VGVGVVIASVAGSSFYCSRPSTVPGRLEDRVRQFWDAKVAGDWEKAYSFEAASKTGGMGLGQYLRMRTPMLKYVGYEIVSMEEKGDRAGVEVAISYTVRYPLSRDISSSLRAHEAWLKVDGIWYHETVAGPGFPVTANQTPPASP
jgi:hypothetical protein